jgi:hypothetical protein
MIEHSHAERACESSVGPWRRELFRCVASRLRFCVCLACCSWLLPPIASYLRPFCLLSYRPFLKHCGSLFYPGRCRFSCLRRFPYSRWPRLASRLPYLKPRCPHNPLQCARPCAFACLCNLTCLLSALASPPFCMNSDLFRADPNEANAGPTALRGPESSFKNVAMPGLRPSFCRKGFCWKSFLKEANWHCDCASALASID